LGSGCLRLKAEDGAEVDLLRAALRRADKGRDWQAAWLRPVMFHVLRATCYKVVFPREFEDLGGEGRLFHVLHATKMGYMGAVRIR
jgi:hypothetical protein